MGLTSPEDAQTETLEKTNPGLAAFLSRLEMPQPEDTETLKQYLPIAVEVLTEDLQTQADRLSEKGGFEFAVKVNQDLLKLLKFEPLTEGGPFGEREKRLVLSLIQNFSEGSDFRDRVWSSLGIKLVGDDFPKKLATEDDAKKLAKFNKFENAWIEVHGVLKERYDFKRPVEGTLWWAKKVDPEYYRIEGEKEILRMH